MAVFLSVSTQYTNVTDRHRMMHRHRAAKGKWITEIQTFN